MVIRLALDFFNHNGHDGIFTMDTMAFAWFFAFEGHNGVSRRLTGREGEPEALK